MCETMVPKLVAEDIPLLFSLLSDVFPNVCYTRAEMEGLKEQIRKVCAEEFLVCGEGDEQGAHWMEKVNWQIQTTIRAPFHAFCCLLFRKLTSNFPNSIHLLTSSYHFKMYYAKTHIILLMYLLIMHSQQHNKTNKMV